MVNEFNGGSTTDFFGVESGMSDSVDYSSPNYDSGYDTTSQDFGSWDNTGGEASGFDSGGFDSGGGFDSDGFDGGGFDGGGGDGGVEEETRNLGGDTRQFYRCHLKHHLSHSNPIYVNILSHQ